MAVVLANNAVSRLSATLSTGATALSITPGEGAKFPSPSVGNWFPLTIVKASGALEIVRCTSRSGDVLTVVRAQEGTAAQPFSVGDRAELRITAAAVADIQQTIADLAGAAMLQASNLADVDDVPSARGNLGLGTVATVNKQETKIDSTEGQALLYGAFGLGASGGGPVIAPNDAFLNGFYRYASDAAGNPSPGTGGSIIVQNIGGNFIQQIAIAPSGVIPKIFVRQFDGTGAPQAWVELWHKGNASAFGNLLLALAGAPEARTLIGSPAGVDKQMCTAWVAFNAAGAMADSFNVSGVSVLSSSSWRLTLVGMTKATYSLCTSAGNISNTARILSHQNKTITTVDVGNSGILDSYGPVANELNSVHFFGGR